MDDLAKECWNLYVGDQQLISFDSEKVKLDERHHLCGNLRMGGDIYQCSTGRTFA